MRWAVTYVSRQRSGSRLKDRRGERVVSDGLVAEKGRECRTLRLLVDEESVDSVMIEQVERAQLGRAGPGERKPLDCRPTRCSRYVSDLWRPLGWSVYRASHLAGLVGC